MNTATQINELEIKRYLFGEMSDEEREQMENDFFENDELFFEIADTENHLVDLYAHGKLAGEELTKFERSLEKFPERRAKIANAVALQTFIAEERPQEVAETVVVGQTIWQKIAEFFTIKTPAFGYSMATLMLLFALATVFLLVDNRRKSGEIAGLQNSRQTDFEQKIKELEGRIEYYNASLEELKNQSNALEDAGGAAVADYQKAEEEKERLEKELEQIRKEKNIVPTPSPKQSSQQIFAFLLTPTVGTRGGSGSSSRSLTVPREAKQITLRLVLPDGFDKEVRLTVKLNDKTLASNLPAQKNLQIKIAPGDLSEGLNRISIVNAEGKEISKYVFNMQKK